MKMIESTKKRKNLFIQIILPLIIAENNRIKLNRIKLFSILNKNHNSNSERYAARNYWSRIVWK